VPESSTGEAAALLDFLTAPAEQWLDLAPDVVREVGTARLEQIVAATRARTGPFATVTDSPGGLVITGPRGQVPAWAALRPDGTLAGLRIGRRPVSPRRRRRAIGRWQRLAWSAYPAAVAAWNVFALCTEGSVTAWAGDFCSLMGLVVLIEGFGAPARLSRWLRGAGRLCVVAALGSVWRLPEIPLGRAVPRVAAGVVFVVAALWALRSSRAHRWGTAVSQPLRFPLRGTWYVVQGGGRLINHHASVPAQRAAIDLVMTGPRGTRTGRGTGPDAYLAYGRPVSAPCDGVVVSAGDGIDDQTPGRIRFQPPYGNHVFIDTGHEIVKLAHLRRGSVLVKPGERVRAGDPIGEVGNSGNSTEPHLHIHAERDGIGVDLAFTEITGNIYRGVFLNC
jgi:hypothetical protein